MRDVLDRLARALRIVLGAPRYDAYCAHMERHHPELRAMARTEFERSRLDDRYSKPGAKCC